MAGVPEPTGAAGQDLGRDGRPSDLDGRARAPGRGPRRKRRAERQLITGLPSGIVAAQEAVTLTPTQEVSIYTDFLESGQLRLFFGYQLPEGVIVYNGEQPVELVVKELVTD